MGTFQTRQYKELAECMHETVNWTVRMNYSVPQCEQVLRVLISYLNERNDNMNVEKFYVASGITDPNTGST